MLNWTAFDFFFLALKTWFSRFTITIAQPDRSKRVSAEISARRYFCMADWMRCVLLLDPSDASQPGSVSMDAQMLTTKVPIFSTLMVD